MRTLIVPPAFGRALLPALAAAAALLSRTALAAPSVAINEVHYHPVELPAFTPDGLPVLDLTRDVHEFVELHNFGPTNVSLAGWRLSGDIEFDFPTNASLNAGQYLVIARDPARLAAIPQYTSLHPTNLFGPYSGNLGNNGGTIRLRDPLDATVDAVSYSSRFPWAISADALGAGDEWTGLRETNFQYRGRSLERLSVTWPANDPANWLASPTNGPSPGRSNAVVRSIPRPVVTSFAAYGTTNGDPIIRSSHTVKIDCQFSSTNALSSVSVQYFLDDINSTSEAQTISTMSPVGAPAEGRFMTTLPARPDRTVVRYRIRANRGGGIEVVSPRADDPFLWHAYFITPVRTSTNRIYDCFISTASLNTLATNLNPANPSSVDISVRRRIQLPDPPGIPSVTWNATEPAILVYNGQVFDARARYHGSQYRRAPGNNSWKWQFPRYQRLENRGGIFISDNTDETVVCGELYRLAGVPQSYTRWMDFYLNNTAGIRRMDQDEMDDDMLERFFAEQRLANPDLPKEGTGEFYKSQGNFLFSDPTGPYGYGGYRLLPARPPYWTELQRYENTFGLQMHGWKGHDQFMQMLKGMWAARGDTHTAVNPNTNALRSWLLQNFDVETSLASIAIRVWSGGWDNFNHNHFLWRRENGKWVVLQWDFDSELGGFANAGTSSIYLSQYGIPLIYTTFGTTPLWVDANWVNDSLLRAFNTEYRRKLFILNNTLLNPTNITALGFGAYRSYANTRFSAINSQAGLGTFLRPNRPTHLTPLANQSVLPPVAFTASAYSHGASPAPAHGSTTWFVRNASGSYDAPILKRTSTTNLTSLPIPFDLLAFGQTYYWKCLYTDTNGHPSLESAETAFVYGGTITAPGSIVLNELLADNRGAATNGNSSPDYVELLNTTGTAQSLNGLSLSDDILQPGKYVFPPGATIGPFGRLVVWCDDNTNAPGLHTGFGLDNDGQTLALFAIGPGTYQLADVVQFGLQAPNFSLARDPEGFGTWSLATPTPGADNAFSTTPTDAPAGLRINEWMATDAGGPDWFELYNPSTFPVALGGLYWNDAPTYATNSPIALLSFIGPGRHIQFIADSDPGKNARHVDFRLSGSGDTISLFQTPAVRVDSITFGPQLSGVSEGRLPDGTTNIIAFPASASPNDPNYLPLQTLVINEVLSHSDPPLEDAVELRNLTGTSVNVGGWWLSDDKNDPRKYQLPPGAMVPANGYLVLYEYQFNPAPGTPGSFAFSSAQGDAVHLSAADAGGTLTGERASASFDASETGVSHGRFPTSQGVHFVSLASRTFGADNAGTVEGFRQGTGAANAYARVGPVVISELMYRPPDLSGSVDNNRDEFIELRNLSGQPVPLYSGTNVWRLRDAVSYSFPPNTTLNAGETVLVVGFDPVADTNALQGFIDSYGPMAVRLFGPWNGELNNASDSVELVKPDAPVADPGPDYGYVPVILVDKVRYEDHFPWPEGTDGDGYSLMRSWAAGYGNDPTNWFGWFATPGLANFVNLAPIVSLTTPAQGSVFVRPTNILLSASASDPDGTVSRVEFFDDTNRLAVVTAPPYQYLWTNAPLGLRTVTARARDNGFASAVSAPVTLQVATLPPVVSLTSPAAGAFYQSGANVPLAATATDPDTPVSKVEFYVDDTKVAEDTIAPYTGAWPASVPGYRFIRAVATDISGVQATSAVRRIFVQAVTNVSTVLVASNATWRYFDTGANQGTAWTNLNFNDASWGSGPAELGFGDQPEGRPEATLLIASSGTGAITYYFRHKFVLPDPVTAPNLTLSVIRDDGAIGYLNGVEIFRDNMPAGAVNYLTAAPTAIAGTGESTFIPTNVAVARLVAGTNILAFEVHQQSTTSSDLSFVAELRTPTTTIFGPAITSHPAGRTNLPGDNVTFSVNASGTAPLRYQWLLNGTPLPGRTNATLSLNAVSPAQAGAYSVTVSNTLAAVTSDPALLVIGEADTDGDGIPDSWENEFGLDPMNFADAGEDPDTDGSNNRSEYIAGTHPLDPQSYLRFDSIARGRAALLSFLVVSNTSYTVQYTDALGGPWSTLATVPPGAATRTETLVDLATGNSRFYRLSTPQQPQSPLQISSVSVAAEASLLSFSAVSNRTYRVEYSGSAAGPWATLSELTARTITRPVTVADPASTPGRLYRLLIPAP